MKPFISNASKDARKVLAYQIQNCTNRSLREALLGASIRRILIPIGHSCREAWLVRLILDNAVAFDFSATSTDVGNWREIGSLNIEIRELQEMPHDPPSLNFDCHDIAGFRILKIERIVYEETGLWVENGIVLTSEKGEEIWIAAAPAPGAVSIRTPFCNTEFEPEIAIHHCRRIPI